jgi:hypothetical protein
VSLNLELKRISKFIHERSSTVTKSPSLNHEVTRILCDTNVNYQVHKSPPMGVTLITMNPVHRLLTTVLIFFSHVTRVDNI